VSIIRPSFQQWLHRLIAPTLGRCCLALLCLAWSFAPAEYFSDYQRKPVSPPPENAWGLLYEGSWFSGAYDHGLALAYYHRLQRQVAFPITVATFINELGVHAQTGLRWFPSGNLRKDGFENFVEGDLGVLARKAPWDPTDSTTKWVWAPQVVVEYGRDILPWSDAKLGIRLSLFGSWAFGNKVLARSAQGVFGLSETKLGNIILGFRIGGFWL